MSSFIGSGLRSHGVCVELLVTVMSSALAIVPLVTDDAVDLMHKINDSQIKPDRCYKLCRTLATNGNQFQNKQPSLKLSQMNIEVNDQK